MLWAKPHMTALELMPFPPPPAAQAALKQTANSRWPGCLDIEPASIPGSLVSPRSQGPNSSSQAATSYGSRHQRCRMGRVNVLHTRQAAAAVLRHACLSVSTPHPLVHVQARRRITRS